jgi:hypothetical protein
MNMQIRKALAALALVALGCTLVARAQSDRKSPHQTADVTLADKQISITYGRPFLRGRTVGGEVAPYGQVWRTGADEATTLTTAADLNIAGTELPAGKYTLWTLPSEGAWKLIINKQTGQWGTNYDQAQDLARVDMLKSNLDKPVDQFKISWKTNGEHAADLVFEWGSTRVWVPVHTK